MKRNVRKTVSYSNSFKSMVVYKVVAEGISIALVCMQFGIDEVK